MQPSEIAAGAGQVHGLIWAAPFLGVLASIALLPAVAPRFWHRRMSWVVAFWILVLLVPEAVAWGPAQAAAGAWRAVLVEYLPFVTLLLALFTVGGGVLVRGGVSGTPAGNTALLAIGTVLAGVMGTTGAAMVLIHPLLRANAHRQQKMHLALVFILLVANAGGALSPLGDPPLYLGYLHGVPFFWPVRHLGLPLALLAGVVLAVFWPLDAALARREGPPPPRERLHIRGWGNAMLVLLTGATVLVLGGANLGVVSIAGQEIGAGRLISIGVFVAITAASAWLTPRSIHQGNDFSWHPMIEVALLFLAIFITIEPVLHMLEAGMAGPFAPLLRLLTDADGNPLPVAYFWLTGGVSAFLDNAPSYLVFFEIAGIRPETLSLTRSLELEAMSAGAVFFGALTYIGNAPNMMVRAIAAHRGVRMPGFFGFMAMAVAVLIPVFAVLTVVFFRP
ncbi:MAG TPA: sodium:proton antiporter [Acetobacteraceae bacterium]